MPAGFTLALASIRLADATVTPAIVLPVSEVQVAFSACTEGLEADEESLDPPQPTSTTAMRPAVSRPSDLIKLVLWIITLCSITLVVDSPKGMNPSLDIVLSRGLLN